MKLDDQKIINLEKNLEEYYSYDGRKKDDPFFEEEMEEEVIDVKREVISTILYIVAALIITFLFITYVGERTLVIGSSMESTISDGDQLFVDKISYRFHDAERYDIVVFPSPFDGETNYIKRIIGLPGETVYIDENGDVFINGVNLHEHYGLAVIEDPGMAAEPITLGIDEYFVMGDNRNNSLDSRFPTVGPIKGDVIIGKAWVRLYPFSKFGKSRK